MFKRKGRGGQQTRWTHGRETCNCLNESFHFSNFVCAWSALSKSSRSLLKISYDRCPLNLLDWIPQSNKQSYWSASAWRRRQNVPFISDKRKASRRMLDNAGALHCRMNAPNKSNHYVVLLVNSVSMEPSCHSVTYLFESSVNQLDLLAREFGRLFQRFQFFGPVA